MSSEDRPAILCVDDQPQMLELLGVLLRRQYTITTASSGVEALRVLEAGLDAAVIVSDMDMPGMDGAAFLRHSRRIRPDAVRILLTGRADLKAAIAAINDGQIFRFLTKPCPPPALVATVQAAVEQHRLITAERVLLEQTLHGAVKALTDILAFSNPTIFGRALRVKQHVTDLAVHLDIPDRWQIEVAAMFSKLGLISLPPETAEKLHQGEELSAHETEMVAKMPAIAEQLLANIPRLEDVRDILARCQRPFRPIEPGAEVREASVRRSAHVLRVALDFDVLDERGVGGAIALGTLRGRTGTYDPALLTALEEVRASRTERLIVREVRLQALRPGMVFAEDVELASGTLLVARGYEVTERFIERIRNFAAGTVRDPLRVTGTAALLAAG